jgi:exonuclease III
MDSNINIIVWNVRGLNYGAHHDALRNLVIFECPSIVCVQETKLVVIDDYILSQLLGTSFDYVFLLAAHTRGGILVAWKASKWSASCISTRTFSISG